MSFITWYFLVGSNRDVRNSNFKFFSLIINIKFIQKKIGRKNFKFKVETCKTFYQLI